MAESQTTAYQTIGILVKGSGEARKELSNRIKAAKEQYDKELLIFKTNIRTKYATTPRVDNPSGGSNRGGSAGDGFRTDGYRGDGAYGNGHRGDSFRSDGYRGDGFRGASRGGSRGGRPHTNRGRPY